MSRLGLILFSFTLLVVSYFGVTNPANSLQWLFTVNPTMQITRIWLAILLLLYALFPREEFRLGPKLLKLLGLALLLVSVTTVINPEIYGLTSPDSAPLDIMMLFESTIVVLLTSLEPAWNPRYDQELEPAMERQSILHQLRRFRWQPAIKHTHIRLPSYHPRVKHAPG